MDPTFFAYLQRLEAMAFFSGYPLIYAIGFFIAENLPPRIRLKHKIIFLLPTAYALVGASYLGLQLKALYPDYSIENIQQSIPQPYLVAWGVLAILFWVPSIGKRPVLSLLHGLTFFYFLVKDMYFQLSFLTADKNIVRNDMRLYTDSLLLNSLALVAVMLIYFLFIRFKGSKDSPGV